MWKKRAKKIFYNSPIPLTLTSLSSASSFSFYLFSQSYLGVGLVSHHFVLLLKIPYPHSNLGSPSNTTLQKQHMFLVEENNL